MLKKLNFLLGVLYILLPSLILIIGIIQNNILDSISQSYYANYNFIMITVMILIAIIYFLLPVDFKKERIINIIISIAILLCLIFPKVNEDKDLRVGLFQLKSLISDIFHVIFTFVVLLGISLEFINYGKKKKRYIYLGTSILIFALILALGRTIFNLNDYFPFGLYMELIIFGISGTGYILKSY
jgi:hypothetical protein